MPPLLDSEDALARALASVPPAERERIEAERRTVTQRAAAASVTPEQRRLAEALILSLSRPPRALP